MGMKVNEKGDLEITLDTFEEIMNSRRTDGFPPAKICECGTIGPLWEWAKRDEKTGCPKCKALPSMEDLMGHASSTTPPDWKPK